MAKAKSNGNHPSLKSALLKDYDGISVDLDVNVIPTGVGIVDRLLGGGFAENKLNLVCGAEGSGKSTLMYQAIKKAMDLGYFAVLLEQEGGVSKGRLADFGIKEGENLLLLQPPDLEAAEEVIEKIAKNNTDSKILKETDAKDYKGIVIFWDSITAAQPAQFFEESSADGAIGLKARLLSKMLGKFPTICKESKITIVAVSQLKTKIDMNPFATKISALQLNENVIPGGNSLRFQPFMILSMNPKGAFKLSKSHKAAFGRIVECKSLKNKFTNPMLPLEIVFSYKKGFSDTLTMWHILQDKKKIKSSGQKYVLDGFKQSEEDEDDLKFSMPQFAELLKQDKAFKSFCLETYAGELDKIISPGDTKKMEELI